MISELNILTLSRHVKFFPYSSLLTAMSLLTLPSQPKFCSREEIREKSARNCLKLFAPLQLLFFPSSNSILQETCSVFSVFFQWGLWRKNLLKKCKMVEPPHCICSPRGFTLAFDQPSPICQNPSWTHIVVSHGVSFRYVSQHSNEFKGSCELAFYQDFPLHG